MAATRSKMDALVVGTVVGETEEVVAEVPVVSAGNATSTRSNSRSLSYLASISMNLKMSICMSIIVC